MTGSRFIVVALALALGACDGCGDDGASSPAASAPTGPPSKLPLNPSDVVRLSKQRKIVKTALRAHHGVELEGAPADVPNLQRLIDEGIFSREELYERQSIGVAFGDAIAKELSLRWVMVLRDHGTEPALCCGPDDSTIDVISMITDPLDRGEKVDLAALKASLTAQLRKASD